MGDVVNLRRARKRRQRQDADAEAESNRVRFGRSRTEKARDRVETQRASRDLDGKRLDEPEA